MADTSAFSGCSFCCGDGCMCCERERRKAAQADPVPLVPLFTADPNDPEDMELLKHVVGGPALEKAFGPGGRGMGEIYENALVANLAQITRDAFRKPEKG